MKPWISGPKELLDHAITHMASKSPFDCRIAMISIDNAVELAIKTFLGLPKRVRRSDGPSRKKLQEASQRFPDLLDLLEEYADDRLDGIDLGDIEGYHRLRNTLYHDGNGVTVDPRHVDTYLQISKIILRNLLGIEPEEVGHMPPTASVGELVLSWANLERLVRDLAKSHVPKGKSLRVPVVNVVDALIGKGVLSGSFRSRLEKVSQVRNAFVHGISIPPQSELSELISELNKLIAEIQKT